MAGSRTHSSAKRVAKAPRRPVASRGATEVPPVPPEAAPGPGKYDRQQPLDARRSEQRVRLLQAAAQVFAMHGYTGSSVDLIIKEVRMSRRTFYEHFKDLEEVLLAVYQAGARILSHRVREAVEAETQPLAKVREGILSYLSAMRDGAPLARVLYREIYSLGPAHMKRHAEMREEYVNIWLDGFRSAYEAGFARRVPDEITVHALSAAIEAIAMRYIDRGEEQKILEAAPALVAIAVTAVQYSDSDIHRILVASEMAPPRELPSGDKMKNAARLAPRRVSQSTAPETRGRRRS